MSLINRIVGAFRDQDEVGVPVDGLARREWDRECLRRGTKPLPGASREEHRRYADRFGYFWLPCPVCTEPFGGHEATGASVPVRVDDDQPGVLRGACICPRCAAVGAGGGYERQAEEMREEWMEAMGGEVQWATVEMVGVDVDTMRENANPRMTPEQVEDWISVGHDPSSMCSTCGMPMLYDPEKKSWGCYRSSDHRNVDRDEHVCCGTCGLQMEQVGEGVFECRHEHGG